MQLIDSLVGLRSVRSFKPKEIPEDVLKKILEAGRHAPSHHNIQPWHFVVVSNPETKKKLAKGKAKFIEDSALVIVGCGDPEKSPRWYELEVAIAMQLMVITAWVQGIGSCWIDIENTEEQVEAVLSIPKELEVVALVAFGYPARATTPESSWKKPLDQIIHYDKFQ